MKAWLKKDEVIGGASAGRMAAAGEEWQIYRTSRESYLLAVTTRLAADWKDYQAFNFCVFESSN